MAVISWLLRESRNTLITQQLTAKPMDLNPVELYSPLAATFRTGSYGLLQEVICELL